MPPISRREFLERAGWALGTAAAGVALAGQAGAEEKKGAELPRRPLGKTGLEVAVLGLGGHTISTVALPVATRAVHRLLDEGANYVDTASSYGDSEEKLGTILRGRRDKLVLATKILKRTREEARREFETSLRRLKVESVDLLQIHAINTEAERRQVMGAGGSLEAAVEAREKGWTRFIGITGHRRAEVLAAALRQYPFATLLIPLSVADHWHHDFGPTLLPLAREKGAGVIAMKVLGAGRLVGQVPLAAAVRYVLDQPVATAILGMKTEEEVVANLAAARSRPLSAAERQQVLAAAGPHGTDRVLWWKR